MRIISLAFATALLASGGGTALADSTGIDAETTNPPAASVIVAEPATAPEAAALASEASEAKAAAPEAVPEAEPAASTGAGADEAAAEPAAQVEPAAPATPADTTPEVVPMTAPPAPAPVDPAAMSAPEVMSVPSAATPFASPLPYITTEDIGLLTTYEIISLCLLALCGILALGGLIASVTSRRQLAKNLLTVSAICAASGVLTSFI